jgi:Cytochrome c554 and c-prime
MKQITRYKRSAIAICIIICNGFFLTQCINRQNDEPAVIKKVNFKQFAGSATCANCHKDIYNIHIHTAHYNTSQPATATTLKGSFEPGKNSFSYSEHTTVAMEKRDSSFYQVAYADGVEKLARRFDIVMGSGAKGQTSAYWHNNQLFQLPITYFTAANEWSNSPGYPQKAIFNRPISSRCMECHSTYANTISAAGIEPEEFEHTSIIYGVDCEKCHGPGAAHAAFQLEHPAETKGKFIINPTSLLKQQQLDACALCHGGKLQKTKPSFEFIAGDKLSDYFTFDTTTVSNADNIDVHGNQYGLLRASKCFRISETMTCNTCHNPHENERGKIEVFSRRCTSCHTTNEHGNGKICKMTASLGISINNNCIDCHMPAKASRAIAVFLPGASIPVSAYIRSHFISIYPEETKKIMDKKKATSH